MKPAELLFEGMLGALVARTVPEDWKPTDASKGMLVRLLVPPQIADIFAALSKTMDGEFQSELETSVFGYLIGLGLISHAQKLYDSGNLQNLLKELFENITENADL